MSTHRFCHVSLTPVCQRNKGIVSEAGLERLAKRLELEVLWEMERKTLIIGGSALELVIVFSSKDIVESATLDFPESSDMVKKHTAEAGRILTSNLKLADGQSPLTKRMDSFVANFERIANLDKLSVYPVFNLNEAVAGLFESLNRLHAWEWQKAREDPTLTGKTDDYIHNLILCTRSGGPSMNARDRVGLSVDYWIEQHLVARPADPEPSKQAAEEGKIWSILVGCAPLRDINVSPVRVSDKWISVDIEKATLPGELHTGQLLDWLEPENTFINPDPAKEAAGGDPMQSEPPLLGPRLPEVAFLATFDPPIHVTLSLWQNLQQLGCGLPDVQSLQTFDTLVFPVPLEVAYDPSEPRTITCVKQVESRGPGETAFRWRPHRNTLYVYKPIYGRNLREFTFSHPQQIVNMLPFFRQYTFLSTLLEKSFREEPAPAPARPAAPKPRAKTTITTNMDDFSEFMERENSQANDALRVDVTLSVHPIPRLQIVFPFRSTTANVVLDIRENGSVHIVSQNILDESNAIGPEGKARQPEDLGKILETCEDIGTWCEFLRARWS